MSWKTKRMLKKWGLVALVAMGLFVGYTHHQRGGRASVGSLMTSAKVATAKIPFIGPYLAGGNYRKYSGHRKYSNQRYAYGRKKARSRKARSSRRRRR